MPKSIGHSSPQARKRPETLTASQVLSKVYKQVLREQPIHKAIAVHVEKNAQQDDDNWKMVVL
ncbi:hypothetical protein OAJ94_02635 [Deltaproteobacteria bacterium]|nr:hypothetical protein [Deltaproteobacteria bacterium]